MERFTSKIEGESLGREKEEVTVKLRNSMAEEYLLKELEEANDLVHGSYEEFVDATLSLKDRKCKLIQVLIAMKADDCLKGSPHEFYQKEDT